MTGLRGHVGGGRAYRRGGRGGDRRGLWHVGAEEGVGEDARQAQPHAHHPRRHLRGGGGAVAGAGTRIRGWEGNREAVAEAQGTRHKAAACESGDGLRWEQ